MRRRGGEGERKVELEGERVRVSLKKTFKITFCSEQQNSRIRVYIIYHSIIIYHLNKYIFDCIYKYNIDVSYMYIQSYVYMYVQS